MLILIAISAIIFLAADYLLRSYLREQDGTQNEVRAANALFFFRIFGGIELGVSGASWLANMEDTGIPLFGTIIMICMAVGFLKFAFKGHLPDRPNSSR